jgi:hypothetical protein
MISEQFTKNRSLKTFKGFFGARCNYHLYTPRYNCYDHNKKK